MHSQKPSQPWWRVDCAGNKRGRDIAPAMSPPAYQRAELMHPRLKIVSRYGAEHPIFSRTTQFHVTNQLLTPMNTTQKTKALQFQELHRAPGTFLIPNPWDAGSARLL